MTRQYAIAALRQQAGALKALGATELYLFGSTARDDADLESDLDLFIDYDRGSRFSLVELVGVKQLLERPPWRSGRCDDPRQPGSAAQGPNRGFGRARFLTERLVQPALHAVRNAITDIEQAVRRKSLDDLCRRLASSLSGVQHLDRGTSCFFAGTSQRPSARHELVVAVLEAETFLGATEYRVVTGESMLADKKRFSFRHADLKGRAILSVRSASWPSRLSEDEREETTCL